MQFPETIDGRLGPAADECAHRDDGREQARVRAALDKVGLLNKEKEAPITLSGGEQQRVGIARAVVSKPPLVLADEPTGNLDPELAKEIMGLFSQFNQVGVTLLVATHNIDLITRMGKRILSLSQGQLVGDSQKQGLNHNLRFVTFQSGRVAP